MEHSIASAPEFWKNTVSAKLIAHSLSAGVSPSGMRKRLETCQTLWACLVSASASYGCAWPSALTATPAVKSRYRSPSAVTSHAPSPRSNARSTRAYVGNRCELTAGSFVERIGLRMVLFRPYLLFGTTRAPKRNVPPRRAALFSFYFLTLRCQHSDQPAESLTQLRRNRRF